MSNKAKIGDTEYEGQITNNRLNGKGFIKFKNDFILEGKFINNKLDRDSLLTLIDLNQGKEITITKYDEETNVLETEDF